MGMHIQPVYWQVMSSLAKRSRVSFSSKGPSVLYKYIFESKEGNSDIFSSSAFITAYIYQNPQRASSVPRWGHRCMGVQVSLGNYKAHLFDDLRHFLRFKKNLQISLRCLKTLKESAGTTTVLPNHRKLCSTSDFWTQGTRSFLPTVGSRLLTFQCLSENAGWFLQSPSETENNKENGETWRFQSRSWNFSVCSGGSETATGHSLCFFHYPLKKINLISKLLHFSPRQKEGPIHLGFISQLGILCHMT